MLKWFRREAQPVADTSGISISRPWVRPDATLPTQAGGFFVVTNKGTEPDRLLAAASPLADKIEIHAIKVAGPGARMQALADGLVIPAGSTLELRPRGYHLLMTGMMKVPAAGSRLPITLAFEKAGRVEIKLVVEAPGPVDGKTLDQPG